MYHLTQTKKYDCQKCHRKIRRVDIEKIFQEQLKGFVFREEDLRAELAKTKTQVTDFEQQLSALRSEKKKVDDQIQELLRLHSTGEIPTKGFGKLYQPLFERQEELEESIPQIEGKRDAMNIDAISTDQIILDAQDLYTKFNTLPHLEQRSIVKAVTESIVVDDEQVTIKLNYITPAQKEQFGVHNSTGSSRPPA